MDEFGQFVKEHSLSDISILERVDEYALYCFYLGYEPEIGLKHNSPLRFNGNSDDFSSFGIFVATRVPNREFMWKDHGTGRSGDIFKLIKEMYAYKSDEEVYRRIDTDFNLGFTQGVPIREKLLATPVRHYVEPVDIRVRSRKIWYPSELLYWQSYGSSKPLLEEYNVTPPEMYWLTTTQQDPIIPKGLCFAYRVGSKYKIYKPHAPKDQKFRNNFTDRHIEGFEQLSCHKGQRYNRDLLIITKSLKDVMCLRSFGYEAVAARSENTVLPEDAQNYLQRKYKYIMVLFDNDGKHLGERYPYDLIQVPDESGEKDVSDHYHKYDRDRTGVMLLDIIGR